MTTQTIQKTALHDEHLRLGAKMTDFHGWDMPLYYTSILDEHTSVRVAVGIFDISHMGQVWVSGPGALQALNELVVSDLSQVGLGRACYTLLTNERGGIVDDLIIYRTGGQDFLVIVNCANRGKDVDWITQHVRAQVDIKDISAGRAILAIQGPKVVALLEGILGTSVSGLGRFSAIPLSGWGHRAWIARTGYTGSDGFELFLEDAHARKLWQRCLASGMCKPVGLGARDTLRLEAGLRLYGTDMDDDTSPYEADLGWTVAINKPSFIGKDVLVKQKASGVSRKMAGFELPEGPVPRSGCALMAGGRQVGSVTSGTFSLMLKKPIGVGYVEPASAAVGTTLGVAIRSKEFPATVVKLPFWRKS
jgi:aminomethyltransferase